MNKYLIKIKKIEILKYYIKIISYTNLIFISKIVKGCVNFKIYNSTLIYKNKYFNLNSSFILENKDNFTNYRPIELKYQQNLELCNKQNVCLQEKSEQSLEISSEQNKQEKSEQSLEISSEQNKKNLFCLQEIGLDNLQENDIITIYEEKNKLCNEDKNIIFIKKIKIKNKYIFTSDSSDEEIYY